MIENLLNYDRLREESDVNVELVNYVMENSFRDATGRLTMPALWDRELIHLLPNNYTLARKVLNSLFKKFHKDPSKLNQYDSVIQQQLKDGIIERVTNYEKLIGDKDSSFVAHNAVFKESSATTKCRIVLLSNLCEKGESNLSHNQVSQPGPNLNSKSYIACILLRFNKYLITYDLVKAYLQLNISDEDSRKLNFLWFEGVSEGKFDEVCYRIRRVPFGMRFSATLLMLALYMILILDHEQAEFNKIKDTMYNLSYMDHIAFSSHSEDELKTAFQFATKLFNSYGFELQKICTNSQLFKNSFQYEESSSSGDTEDMFGLKWDSKKDTIKTKLNKLDQNANTLRKLLGTINAVYDPLGINLPTMNRAKTFLYYIQNSLKLKWDDSFPEKEMHEIQ